MNCVHHKNVTAFSLTWNPWNTSGVNRFIVRHTQIIPDDWTMMRYPPPQFLNNKYTGDYRNTSIHTAQKNIKMGSYLSISKRHLEELYKLRQNITVLNKNTVSNFVFVTAANSGHFNNSLDTVGSVQYHFPDKLILYYDLGLTANEKLQVSKHAI